jgi:hypothetical protein
MASAPRVIHHAELFGLVRQLRDLTPVHRKLVADLMKRLYCAQVSEVTPS